MTINIPKQSRLDLVPPPCFLNHFSSLNIVCVAPTPLLNIAAQPSLFKNNILYSHLHSSAALTISSHIDGVAVVLLVLLLSSNTVLCRPCLYRIISSSTVGVQVLSHWFCWIQFVIFFKRRFYANLNNSVETGRFITWT